MEKQIFSKSDQILFFGGLFCLSLLSIFAPILLQPK